MVVPDDIVKRNHQWLSVKLNNIEIESEDEQEEDYEDDDDDDDYIADMRMLFRIVRNRINLVFVR